MMYKKAVDESPLSSINDHVWKRVSLQQMSIVYRY